MWIGDSQTGLGAGLLLQ